MLGTPLSKTSLARRSQASSKGRIWPTAACVEDLRTKPRYGHPQTGPDTGILKQAWILVSHSGRGGLLSHLGLTQTINHEVVPRTFRLNGPIQTTRLEKPTGPFLYSW